MVRDTTRRDILRHVGAGAVATPLLGGPAAATVGSDTTEDDTPAVAPAFAGEFVIRPLATAAFPTAIRFGPGDGGFGDPGAGDANPDLYAATLGGSVVRYHLVWTDAGLLVRDRTVAAGDFSQPLGIAFHGRGPPAGAADPPVQAQGPKDDALVVSDSHMNDNTGRTDGVVYLVESDGTRKRLVDGLPNGRHNTNHVAFGPGDDDRLYITNGNTTDDGCEGGDPEVLPYSGAILAVDLDEVEEDPAVLRWVDENGDRIPPEAIPDHSVNADFAETVDVVAHGFRNVYGLAFDHDGTLHTGMNGADDPASPDVFYRLDEPAGTDYRYPFCFNTGPVGVTGDAVRLEPNPAAPGHDCHVFDDVDDQSDLDCDEADHPTADAVVGWHACATGLDFPTDGAAAFPDRFRTDAFMGECGTFTPLASAERTTESMDGRNTGHSVAHIPISDGEVGGVEDFLTGLSLPTDVLFGPEGAMYVADLEAIHRVRPLPG
jgi:glucose/arabinose dehydrogenase